MEDKNSEDRESNVSFIPTLVIEDNHPDEPLAPLVPNRTSEVIDSTMENMQVSNEEVKPVDSVQTIEPVVNVEPLKDAQPVQVVEPQVQIPVTPINEVKSDELISPSIVEQNTLSNVQGPTISEETKPIENIVSTKVEFVNELRQEENAKQTDIINKNNNFDKEKKKHKRDVIGLIIIIVCLIVLVAYLLYDKYNNKNDEKPIDTPVNPQPKPSNLSISQVSVNGTIISFPTTKESFVSLGWKWEETSSKNMVQPGETASGGKIGINEGGVFVNIINRNNEAKVVEDCSIYSATFINPNDESGEKISFIGDINFKSNYSNIKTKMSNVGYSNVTETTANGFIYLRYYLNDDSSNINDYVEFGLLNDMLYSVTIQTKI